MKHPIPAGTVVSWFRTIRNTGRGRIVACEGQLGRHKIWWYRTENNKRICEYDIVAVKA